MSAASPLLLISGFGDHDTGGGLFAWSGDAVERVDRLSSCGIDVRGSALARTLISTGEVDSRAELLLYDELGVRSYLRVDEVDEPHGLVWSPDGEQVVVVSTGSDSVVWVDRAGDVVKRWQAPGSDGGDCWHINDLAVRDGEVFATAFGKFSHHKAWQGGNTTGNGLLFHVESGEPLITGLSCPHTPVPFEDGWLICDSRTKQLRLYDDAGSIRDEVQLDGWTRGVVVTDDHFFVGLSASRVTRGGPRGPEVPNARVAIIDRRDLAVVDHLVLTGCSEIYSLAPGSDAVLEAARRGFRTNHPGRVREEDQYEMFRRAGVEPVRLWAIGLPLPPEACDVRLRPVGDLGSRLPAGTNGQLEVEVENRGGAILVSAPPYPVSLSYRWGDVVTGQTLIEGMRSALSGALLPGEPAICPLRITTPRESGAYRLTITLIQEEVRWFDEVDGDNAWTADLMIGDGAGDGGLAPVPLEPLPASACQARIRVLADTVRTRRHDAVALTVRVRNLGDQSWRVGQNIKLGNHWLDQEGQMLIHDDARADLPHDVEPLQEVELELETLAPDHPGAYYLGFDLVQEGVAWFKDHGSEPVAVPVEVA